VQYRPLGRPVPVRAEEFALEDVVTHVLRNADRHRHAGTPIAISLSIGEGTATVSIHNQGPGIDAAVIDRIFEYGFSNAAGAGHHGQGLFVVRTYLAKMGGTVHARNAQDGVIFELVLQRA
jgi:two-component system OmpR family sensor kinase